MTLDNPKRVYYTYKSIKRTARKGSSTRQQKRRERTVGVSSRVAVGEVVPEHWTELLVGFNGDPSVIGERREHAP